MPLPSVQDLEDMFIGFFKQEIVLRWKEEIELHDGQINAFLNKLKWAKNDSLFRPKQWELQNEK